MTAPRAWRHRICSTSDTGADGRVEVAMDDIRSGLGWLPDGRLLVVAESGQRLLRRERDGSLSIHAELGGHAQRWTNDMVVASDGTAYVGCFGFDLDANAPCSPAPLIKVSPDGEVSIVAEPLHFPNGSIIVDDRILLVAETFGNRISAFDLHDDGNLGPRRDWAAFGPVPTSFALDDRHTDVVIAAGSRRTARAGRPTTDD